MCTACRTLYTYLNWSRLHWLNTTVSQADLNESVLRATFTPSSSSTGGRSGQLKAKQSQEPGRLFSFEDSGSGQGFLLHSGYPMNSTFRDILCNALPFGGQDPVLSQCALKLIQAPTNSHTKCHWGLVGRFEFEGGRIQPSVSSFTWCSETNPGWAKWSVEPKNIHREKEISVVISVDFSVCFHPVWLWYEEYIFYHIFLHIFYAASIGFLFLAAVVEKLSLVFHDFPL